MKAITLSVLLLAGGPALSADFSDPTWPCIQRKVEKLSLGLLWPHPINEGTIRSALEADAQELTETLALRRVELEDGEKLIADFATSHPNLSTDDLGHVFRAVFDRISKDRTEIIAGIARYSLQQISLSEAIGETRVTISELLALEEPDFDKVDILEEKLDWDERIFRDRAQSLIYVCETPVLLEKRAYAIAQILLKHVPN